MDGVPNSEGRPPHIPGQEVVVLGLWPVRIRWTEQFAMKHSWRNKVAEAAANS